MSSLTITNSFVNATTADATQVNTNFSDVKSFVDSHVVHGHDFSVVRCGARVRRVAVQSITNGASTAISWDTEDQDTDGFITPTSTTFTIPSGKAGIYVVSLQAAASVSGRKFMVLTPTSSITGMPSSFRHEMGNDAITSYATSWSLPLNASDTFTLGVFHESGSAVNHTGWASVYKASI